METCTGTWRHRDMDMERWTIGHGYMDMETMDHWTWRHGHGDIVPDKKDRGQPACPKM